MVAFFSAVESTNNKDRLDRCGIEPRSRICSPLTAPTLGRSIAILSTGQTSTKCRLSGMSHNSTAISALAMCRLALTATVTECPVTDTYRHHWCMALLPRIGQMIHASTRSSISISSSSTTGSATPHCLSTSPMASGSVSIKNVLNVARIRSRSG